MADTGRQPLARFVDRHTMVYDREYPHPIERVWEAVTTGEHLDVWLLPESRVERRAGGACAFGWGGPADHPDASRGTVSVFDAPAIVEYTFDDGSFLRFDLSAADPARTALRFTLHFLPGDGREEEYPGGDLPAGPDTAWRPGFLAGYHRMLDRLSPYLDGSFTADDSRRALEQTIAVGFDAEELELVDAYRAHVRAHCPPADDFERHVATFDDRWTMRHTRTYPHPIERVWTAITATEHLNTWLLPTASVEPWEGGRCSFTWGGTSEQVGVVRELDPPRRIVYDLGTSSLRFELTAVDGGTRLDFVHAFAPGAHVEQVDRPGGDQPAGPDSPWRPDFSQGFHVMLDALGVALDGALPIGATNVLKWLAETGQDSSAERERRVEIYRRLIAGRCPPA